MVNSVGKNITNDILNYSNKVSQNNNDMDTQLKLQERLANWYQNNPASVLLNSEKYSGMRENGDHVPLGGRINTYANNIANRPPQNSSEQAFYSDEFPFWNFNCSNNK